MIFVKNTILEGFNNELEIIDLTKGILGNFVNGFYRTEKGSGRLPIENKSVRSLLKVLDRPKTLEYIGELPAAADISCSEECQGVANDGTHWFIAQDKLIHGGLASRGIENVYPMQFIPPDLKKMGYNHFGDLDYYQGNLFVPLEGEDHGLEARVLVFKVPMERPLPNRLALIGSAFLTPAPHGSAAWCAINPLNELLYTSDFSSDFLYVYRWEFSSTDVRCELRLIHLGNFALFNEKGEPLKLRRIQGGVFSKNGHLYLVSDDRDSHGDSGIHGFDMITGRRFLHKHVEYDPDETPPEELEGIDIWDLDSGLAPGMSGQIHLIMLDNDEVDLSGPDDDDIYFKHFRVPRGDEDKI